MLKLVALFVIVEFLSYGEGISFVSNINVDHTKGDWICGEMKCPPDSFGCSVRRRNDCEERNTLRSEYTCLSKQKKELKIYSDAVKMSTPRTIDIRLETYSGARTSYKRWYGIGGETAQGVVALVKWTGLKREIKDDIARSEQRFSEMIRALLKESQMHNGSKINETEFTNTMRYELYGF